MILGLALAAILFALGIGTALRQQRNLRILHARAHVPSDELTYLRRQARRRLLMAAMLVAIGGLIAGSFLSGMEAQATELGDRKRGGVPPDEDERNFVKFYGVYWIVVLLLVFAIVCVAMHDMWATRRYWLGVYRVMRTEYDARLQRDLALHRRQKMEAREARIKRGLGEGDSTSEAN